MCQKTIGLQEFRTLIVCLSEDQDWIRTARRQLEVSLEATPFLNRIFWAVLLEQEKIENLQETQQKLFADFGGNESITLFHVLPFWRGSNLEPEDTSAILERLTVLLLKSDTEASLPMISEIAQNRSGWAIGIEAYRLKGHSEAGKCALFLAARELIAQCFTGQPLSAPTLANLVREKIPDFDSQADLDPFSPEGLEMVGRYVRDYVPELLDALASHSPDVESWLDCLKYLKRETAKPKRLGLLAPGWRHTGRKAEAGILRPECVADDGFRGRLLSAVQARRRTSGADASGAGGSAKAKQEPAASSNFCRRAGTNPGRHSAASLSRVAAGCAAGS